MADARGRPPVAADTRGVLAPRNIDEAWRLAVAVARATGGGDDGAHKALVQIMAGAPLGLDPMTSVRSIHAIPQRGGGVTFALSAELMRALILRSPTCRALRVEVGGEGDAMTATAKGERVDMRGAEQVVTRMERSVSMAECKGIAQGRDGLKANWRDHPKAMLTARASSRLARDLWPDVLIGMLAVEEVDDVAPIREVGPQPAEALGAGQAEASAAVEAPDSEDGETDELTW